MSTESYSELNRNYWDIKAGELYQVPWIQKLTHQITDHLHSNAAWLGLEENPQSPAKMLDYACGYGTASTALLPYVTSIRGIDVSSSMVDKYNANARAAGLSEAQMCAVVGDLLAGTEGELEGEEWHNFDICIVSMGLHHVGIPKVLLRKLMERVKEGGRVVVIDWVDQGRSLIDGHGLGDGHGHKHGHGQGKDDEQGAGEHHSAAHTVAFHGFSEEQMREMFSQAGCTSSDFVLAAEPSEVPYDATGKKQMFFAKGTK